jgi:hypothetical protein
LHREPRIGTWFECKWKKGHANNPDINAADASATEALERQTPADLSQPPPVFQLGMDDFSLIITYNARLQVKVAHPNAGDPSTLITLLHDGKRKHLQNLWSHIHSQQLGRTSNTYHTVHTTTKDIRTYHLKTTQIGYQVLPKRTDKTTPPDPTAAKSPHTTTERNYHTTWYTSDIQLINNLRAGLWNVHDRTFNKQPGFRWCKHCDAMATLHHVLCDCTQPQILAIRGIALTKLQHLTHNPHLTCGKEHLHPPITPTNMANTKWSRPLLQASNTQIPPTSQTPPKPLHCLQLWLGLIPQHIPTSPELIQNLKTLMQGTVAMVHEWMKLVPTNTYVNPETELFKHTSSIKLKQPKPRTMETKPIQPIPRLQPWKILAKACSHPGCLRKTKSPYGRCHSHQTPTMRRTHPRHQPDPQPDPPQAPRALQPLTQQIPANVIITFIQDTPQPTPPRTSNNPWDVFLQDIDPPEPPPSHPNLSSTSRPPPHRLPPPTPTQIKQFQINRRKKRPKWTNDTTDPHRDNPPNKELALQLHHICQSARTLPALDNPPTPAKRPRPPTPIQQQHPKIRKTNQQPTEIRTSQRPTQSPKLPRKPKRTLTPTQTTITKRHKTKTIQDREEVAGLPTPKLLTSAHT